MGKYLGSHSQQPSKCVQLVRSSCYSSERGRGLR